MLRVLRRGDYLYRIYIFRILLVVSFLSAPLVAGILTQRTVQPFDELNPVYITKITLSNRISLDGIYRIYYWRTSQTKIAMTIVTYDHYVHFYLSCKLLPGGDMTCYVDSKVEGMYSHQRYNPMIFRYDFAQAREVSYNARCQWKQVNCTSFVIQ